MANRFKNTTLRNEYDAVMDMFITKHKNLFWQGQPHTGSTLASYFWGGYNGLKEGRFKFDTWGKTTPAYAYYRAGQDAKNLKG